MSIVDTAVVTECGGRKPRPRAAAESRAGKPRLGRLPPSGCREGAIDIDLAHEVLRELLPKLRGCSAIELVQGARCRGRIASSAGHAVSENETEEVLGLLLQDRVRLRGRECRVAGHLAEASEVVPLVHGERAQCLI